MSRMSIIHLAFIFSYFFSLNGLTGERTFMKCWDAPSPLKPLGNYCTVLRLNDTLHLSGLIGIDKSTKKLAEGGIKHETECIFNNLKSILQEHGSSFEKIATVKVYLTDMKDSEAVGYLYGYYIRHPYPARTLVQVSGLPEGAKIMVEVMAVVTDTGRFADPPPPDDD